METMHNSVSDLIFHSLTRLIETTQTDKVVSNKVPSILKKKILKACQKHIQKQSKEYSPQDLLIKDFTTPSGLDQATHLLAERGIVILKNDELKKIAKEAHAQIKESLQEILYHYQLKPGEHYENKDYLIQCGLVKLKSYKEVSSYHKPVINIRAGKFDVGMIDIFKFENLVPQNELIQRYHKKYLPILERIIIPASSKYLRHQHTNLYYNRSVKTRMMHIDSLGKSQYRSTMAKAFLYLHDVELAHGPHAYVVGSHQKHYMNRFNCLYNLLLQGKKSTDMPFYLPDSAVSLTAESGTLLLTFQTGVHGGLPQQSGYSRMVLVENFY